MILLAGRSVYSGCILIVPLPPSSCRLPFDTVIIFAMYWAQPVFYHAIMLVHPSAGLLYQKGDFTS